MDPRIDIRNGHFCRFRLAALLNVRIVTGLSGQHAVAA
jgi:hypothetical protein